MALTLAAVGLVGPTGAAPAAAADPTLTFSGHGWGHGRGMGQWGSYGYATMGSLSKAPPRICSEATPIQSWSTEL